MKILDIVQDTIVDGQGIRSAIYFSKCEHRCVGCHNPQSWNIHNGIEMSLKEVLTRIANNKLIKGVTLTGGDPMFQPKEASLLAKNLKELNYNIWVYTGFTWEEIINGDNEDRKELLKYIDVLVDGKFEIDKKDLSLSFRGSANQRLINVPESLKQNKVVLLDLD